MTAIIWAIIGGIVAFTLAYVVIVEVLAFLFGRDVPANGAEGVDDGEI